MAFQNKPVGFTQYRAWRDAFENEKVYTRQELSHALQEQRRELELAAQLLGVKQLLPNDYEVMMQIIRVQRGYDGMLIVVR